MQGHTLCFVLQTNRLPENHVVKVTPTGVTDLMCLWEERGKEIEDKRPD